MASSFGKISIVESMKYPTLAAVVNKISTKLNDAIQHDAVI